MSIQMIQSVRVYLRFFLHSNLIYTIDKTINVYLFLDTLKLSKTLNLIMSFNETESAFSAEFWA